MANKIYVNTDVYAQIERKLKRLAQELNDCASSLSRVDTDRAAGGTLKINLSGRLSSTGASMPDGQVARCVSSMRSIIRGVREQANALAGNVRETANMFEDTESELARLQPGQGEDAVFSDGAAAAAGLQAVLDRVKEIGQLIGVEITDEFAALRTIGGLIGLDIGGQIIGFFDDHTIMLPGNDNEISLPLPITIVDQLLTLNDLVSAGQDMISDLKTRLHEITSVGAEQSGSVSLFEYAASVTAGGVTANAAGKLFSASGKMGASAELFDADGNFNPSAEAHMSGSASVFSGEASISSEHGSAQASMDFLKAEGQMSGSVQLLDKDGNIAPGMQAKIGGSVTVLDAEASGEYEIIDNVKLHSSMKAVVGQASADAEANIGFDKDGNLNLNASASLEAIAAEVEGDIGVDIAGIDVTGKASLNVGIGAHADAGYKDGVLKLDIGVSVGVGASVALEVDVGGFVDNVTEGVEDLCDNVAEGWNYLCGKATSAWSDWWS